MDDGVINKRLHPGPSPFVQSPHSRLSHSNVRAQRSTHMHWHPHIYTLTAIGTHTQTYVSVEMIYYHQHGRSNRNSDNNDDNRNSNRALYWYREHFYPTLSTNVHLIGFVTEVYDLVSHFQHPSFPKKSHSLRVSTRRTTSPMTPRY